MSTEGKQKAIQQAIEEVSDIAVNSGGGHAHMVQRDADGKPVFLILFCDRTSVNLQQMVDAVNGVVDLWLTQPDGDEENHLG